MRIFFGANVLFSAARSDGAVRRLVDFLHEAGHECWADSYVVEEARRNLAAKSPESVAALKALLGRIQVAAFQPHPSVSDTLLVVPKKDRPVLAAAMRLGCDALVTGDRTHFGPSYGRKLGGVVIHSPRSLFEATRAK
jgi:uncharacterized protein